LSRCLGQSLTTSVAVIDVATTLGIFNLTEPRRIENHDVVFSTAARTDSPAPDPPHSGRRVGYDLRPPVTNVNMAVVSSSLWR
jgi:hypothetical protein